MAVVDLDLFKKHVKADDFTEDDAYLEHLLETAQTHILNYVNRSLEELTALGGGTVPVDIRHAIMLIGGHLYNQREAVSSAQMFEIPYTIGAILKPYQKLVGEQ